MAKRSRRRRSKQLVRNKKLLRRSKQLRRSKTRRKIYFKKRTRRKQTKRKQRGGTVCKALPFGSDTTADNYKYEGEDNSMWVEDWISRSGKDPTPEEMCIWGPDNSNKDCRWNACAKKKSISDNSRGLCTSGKWTGPFTKRSEYEYPGECKWRKKGATYDTVQDE
tara:strand:+ start:727 stop:1221 length:495 start_codon:yes stop_codon:yes gene_type:complete